MGSLVVAFELLVAACMWDLVPRPGIEPRPPALGVWSLNRCATGEVPAVIISMEAVTRFAQLQLDSTFPHAHAKYLLLPALKLL